MSQVKAKKKLHYYQGHEIATSDYKVNEVLSLRDIDKLFDEIDADSHLGLPLLSPLPKNTVNGEKKSESSSSSEMLNAFQSSKQIEVEHKEVSIQENGIEEDELMDKESPFKGIAPIKTSSPIVMETNRDKTVDGVRPVADPLFFGVEDEEPVGGDISEASCTQQSEAVKESLNIDSGSLASPPEKLEFRKTTNPNADALSSMKFAENTKAPVQATQSSPSEMMDEDPSQISPVLVEECEDKLEAEQYQNQVAEDSVRGLSFQHKLKKALMPKSPCSRKQAGVSAALPPADLEEDFMILDDEAPVLFIIPRKADASKNKRPVPADTTKENAELPSADQPPQSEAHPASRHGTDTKKKQVQVDSAKQNLKGKRGKASKKAAKDSVSDVVVEDGANTVTEALEERVCDQASTQNVQEHKAVPAGKRRRNSKPPEPAELTENGETETHGSKEIPESRTTKKSTKSSNQGRQGSKAKKKSNKVNVADLHTANSVKSSKNRKNSKKENSVSKTKKQSSKQQIELVHPSCEEQEHEPSPAISEQEEEQRTVLNKQSPVKKQKSKETKTVEPKPKDPPPILSDISSDSPLCVKRKRNPPGQWWLTSLNESTTDLQPKHVMCTTQRPKANTKTATKKTPAVDSDETPSLRPAQEIKKKQKSRNVSDSSKKVIAGANGCDAGAGKKTPKKKGGQRKQKPTAAPLTTSGQEEGSGLNDNAVEISPEWCSPRRQHSVLAGGKRVFDSVYSRDTGSAKKRLSSSFRRPEVSEPDNIPQKRQRKAPSNWWETPQSQETANELPPPCSPPPQKSQHSPNKVSNTPKKKGNLAKSQKTKNHAKNIKRKIVNTPKSIKRSLASMNAIFASAKNENIVKSGQRRRKLGRRNLLHSLEDQSDHSSETMAHTDDQMQGMSHMSLGFTSGVTVEPSANRNKTTVRVSSGCNRLSDVDIDFRSGPSSMLELQQHDEDDDDIDLPSSRMTHVRQTARVLARCDVCGPPLQPVVLEDEDWNNLHAWFAHLWPPASKNGQVISPDDFHWHSHGGRAMGHMVDLQSRSFSHGKILLGSFMKKPPQVDLDTISVFSVISSCVRVDIEGVKSVFNSGQVFMIPSGQMYCIHNLCQEPAVLIYHRTQSDDT
ncbi:uncharacterized protein si:ch211-161h7.4 isoform X2 [Danio aesculapii]|uniref:uncharacterized protein si:ch211-161h7.4 isoform X2 n=1 Tax=Danio aesculapii TaxID=1142201 RepID=UPI0024C0A57B|nr:uncharacterized protein si:ch211-161h7.4 isoform X2 [Danio aesculapii]